MKAPEDRPFGASWSGERWQQLLIHLVVVGNVVCLRFDLSNTEDEACIDIKAVQIGDHVRFEDAIAKLVPLGQISSASIANAATIANAEIEKPVFPLSIAPGTTEKVLAFLQCMLLSPSASTLIYFTVCRGHQLSSLCYEAFARNRQDAVLVLARDTASRRTDGTFIIETKPRTRQ